MKTIPYLIIAFALLLASCNGGTPPTDAPATNAPTQPEHTTPPIVASEPVVPTEVPVAQLPSGSKRQGVASQGVSILVAPGMKVEDLETFLLVCAKEVVKDSKCFTLERHDPAKSGMNMSNAQHPVLLNGRSFYYNLTAADKGTELTGYLKLGSQWYLVKAIDNDPTWIFPYLAHVELEGGN